MLKVSDTAYSIATLRDMEGERPASERLFEDPYAAIFRAAGTHAGEATERFVALPFMSDGVRLRTRFIDDFVRGGLESGLPQVVLLGSGLDARGLRMPEIAARGARVYEVDFAELLDHKRGLLAAAGVSIPERIAYIPCDFMNPDFELGLVTRLESNGFGRAAGALFVWEGVIAYIDDAAVDRSLGFMARAGGPGTRLVFDYAEARFDPIPAAERARRAGFTSFEATAYDVLWRRHLSGDPPPVASLMGMGIAKIEP